MMKPVNHKMPQSYITKLDELVLMGRFSTRSEAVRYAVRNLLREEFLYSDLGTIVQGDIIVEK